MLLLTGFTWVFLNSKTPSYEGSKVIPGLQSEVRVVFDSHGVPHIYGQNMEDTYLALGYVHASERLFQMDMIRRVTTGRLSEIFGEDLKEVDQLFLTLGIHRQAEESAKKYFNSEKEPWQKAALSYLAGINRFVLEGKKPLEYQLIGMPMEAFEAKDVYLVAGYLAFGFADGFKIDPILQTIVENHGQKYLNDIAVHTLEGTATIPSYRKNGDATQKLALDLQNTLAAIPVPLFQGSNAWVVAGSRTRSGKVMLSNDTHIGFGQPSVWYEAHLEYPGFRLYGHYAAGFPFAILGHTPNYGWGLTMFENDDVDFFIEEYHPDDDGKVKFKEDWEPVTIREEILNIKGSDPQKMMVKSTRHGPIINGTLNGIHSDDAPVSVWWAFLQWPSKILETAWLLNNAKDIDDMRKAASLLDAPGLNVMYGDNQGNIAWWATGKIPQRPPHVNSKLFLDGSSGEDEFLGFYPFELNPQSENPPSAYVYTANNQPDTTMGLWIPGYYRPENRALRITQLIENNESFDTEMMKDMILDHHSVEALEIAKLLVGLTESQEKASEKSDAALKILKGWNGNHEGIQTGPSIYYTFLSWVVKLSMEDELGAEIWSEFASSEVMRRSYKKLISNENSPWWNDKNTDAQEDRATIILKAWDKTIATLSKNFGDEPEEWHWSSACSITHKHPLHDAPIFGPKFSVGPFPIAGGSEVLNALDYKLDTTGYFKVHSGPALRKIIDFSNPEEAISVLPTGQSGNVMSPYYKDQARMFNEGQFRTLLMKGSAVEADKIGVLTLKPE